MTTTLAIIITAILATIITTLMATLAVVTKRLTTSIQHLDKRVTTLEAELAEQRLFNASVMRDSHNIHETIAQSQGA